MLEVLLPFDGSPAALHAVRCVARDRGLAAMRVRLVNVQRVIVDAEMRHAQRSLVRFHRNRGEALLHPARAILEGFGVEHRVEVVFGPVVQAIVRAAEERGCDLVVMGTRNRPPWLELLTRSVSRRVAALTRVPVVRIALPRGSARRLPRVAQASA